MTFRKKNFTEEIILGMNLKEYVGFFDERKSRDNKQYLRRMTEGSVQCSARVGQIQGEQSVR